MTNAWVVETGDSLELSGQPASLKLRAPGSVRDPVPKDKAGSQVGHKPLILALGGCEGMMRNGSLS